MEKKEIMVPVEVLLPGELDAGERRLAQAAAQASERAYAPYSHFCVGAAVELADGTVVEGSNQENAAFPSGMCAERTACYYAHSRHPGQALRTIAIAARNGSPQAELTAEPTPPCGACRQALLEYEKLAGAPVKVLLVGRDKVYRLPGGIASLLPLSFDSF